MKIDTRHTPGDASVVTMNLGGGAEARYTDEQLARIAWSQDRLSWRGDGIASARSAKLRRLPRDRRFFVTKLGSSVSVLITPA